MAAKRALRSTPKVRRGDECREASPDPVRFPKAKGAGALREARQGVLSDRPKVERSEMPRSGAWGDGVSRYLDVGHMSHARHDA